MEEIKVGDIVKLAIGIPVEYVRYWYASCKTPDCRVIDFIGDNAIVVNNGVTLYIPTKYLVKVNAEPKEPTIIRVGNLVDLNERKHLEHYKRVLSRSNLEKELDPTEYKVVTEPYFDWQYYAADLAKEIAVKIINKKLDNDPCEVGEYAVLVAKTVVENLKKSEK